MRLLRQLEFGFRNTAGAEVDDPGAAINDRNNNKDRHSISRKQRASYCTPTAQVESHGKFAWSGIRD